MDSSRPRRGPTLSVRLRYLIDAILSRGALGLLVLSIIISALLLLVVTPILWVIIGIVTGHWDVGELPGLYWSGIAILYRAGNGQGDWLAQLVTFVFAIVSIFFGGVLIGSLVRATSNRFNRLRDKGGTIISQEHTVILGWSVLGPRVLSDLAELSSRRRDIAILSADDKVALEDKISVLPVSRNRVIVRKGSTTSAKDFDRIRLMDAAHVVVLGPWGSPDHDVEVIATLLALSRYREQNPEFKADVVACVADPTNFQPALVAAKHQASVIPVRVMLANITIHVARRPGLFHVIKRLADFTDDLIDFVSVPQLVGKTFAEASALLADDVLLGVLREDVAVVLPDPDLVIGPADCAIILADIGGDISLEQPQVDESMIVARHSVHPDYDGEDWLFLGWAPSISFSLFLLSTELDTQRNSVTVVVKEKDFTIASAMLGSGFPNLDLTIETWPETNSIAEMLSSQRIQERDYIVLPCQDETASNADAETLLLLLHLRQMLDMSTDPTGGPTIVSELLDTKFQTIADSYAARDVVVSNLLVSHFLVQFIRDIRVQPVLRTLLSEASPDVVLNDAADYVEPGREVTFATVCAAATQRGEIALGYSIAELCSVREKDFGMVVKPAKASTVRFIEGDRVIVVAHRANRVSLQDSTVAIQRMMLRRKPTTQPTRIQIGRLNP